MASQIHFKLKSAKEFDYVTFSGMVMGFLFPALLVFLLRALLYSLVQIKHICVDVFIIFASTQLSIKDACALRTFRGRRMKKKKVWWCGGTII